MIIASPSCRNVFYPKSDHGEQKLNKRLVVKSFCANKGRQGMQWVTIMESGQLRIRFLYTYEGVLAVNEKALAL